MDAMPTTDDEWRRTLTPEQYRVLRKSGTERPFTGAYVNCHDDGIYRCAACSAALFSSDAKFDSGTGWPSFTEPAVAEAVTLHKDFGFLGMRTEVRCCRVRLAPRPRVPGRPAAHRQAVLHQLMRPGPGVAALAAGHAVAAGRGRRHGVASPPARRR